MVLSENQEIKKIFLLSGFYWNLSNWATSYVIGRISRRSGRDEETVYDDDSKIDDASSQQS